MKITELKIGDIVCHRIHKKPMRVISLFDIGTVHLNFVGNEDGVFAENCSDLEFVKDEKQKNDEAVYEKCFYNDDNGLTYPTLKRAKASSDKPSIYRCWMQNGEIKAMHQIFGFGTQVATIQMADRIIEHAIRLNIVGHGFKDPRKC